MALRCIIGHDYGDLQTSRKTRERGNEVVVTIREYRECSRCGHQRIITENKEIKAGEADEPADESAVKASTADPSGMANDSTVGVEVGTLSGGLGDHEELTAEEDDGMILEDEHEQPTRGHGEWPDDDVASATASEAAAADPSRPPWPDEAGAGEGHDAQPTGDAVETGGSVGGGLTPEPQGTAGGESTDPEDDGGAEIIDAEAHAAAKAAEDGSASRADTDRPDKFVGPPEAPPDHRDTEFVCPECGATWPTVDASLRPGDICPRCRQGYLAEQVVQ